MEAPVDAPEDSAWSWRPSVDASTTTCTPARHDPSLISIKLRSFCLRLVRTQPHTTTVSPTAAAPALMRRDTRTRPEKGSWDRAPESAQEALPSAPATGAARLTPPAQEKAEWPSGTSHASTGSLPTGAAAPLAPPALSMSSRVLLRISMRYWSLAFSFSRRSALVWSASAAAWSCASVARTSLRRVMRAGSSPEAEAVLSRESIMKSMGLLGMARATSLAIRWSRSCSWWRCRYSSSALAEGGAMTAGSARV
mmetsp:Transcript_27857/g.75057  ORF Transcript_27857/g.75057 Transcript_27857/m.75057 type:complete len:253 (-) Transcript_27857:14-772(-)